MPLPKPVTPSTHQAGAADRPLLPRAVWTEDQLETLQREKKEWV